MLVFKKIWFWVLVFLVVKFVTLTGIPIFTDESIYLRWGIWIWKDFNAVIVPILNGKAPGTALIFGMASLFPWDYFTIARIIAGLFSLGTFAVVFQLASKFRKTEPDWTFFILLIFNPFLLFYAGLAISEVLVMFLYSVILLVYIEGRERMTLEYAARLGFLIGLGWWIKTSVLLVFPCLFIQLVPLFFKQKKPTLLFLVTVLGVFILMWFPGLAIADINKITAYEQHEWVLSGKDLLSFPWEIWQRNFFEYFNHLVVFITPVGLAVLIGGLMRQILSKGKNFLWVWLWVPIVVEIAISRAHYSRYVAIIAPVAVLLIWQELGNFKNNVVRMILVAAIAFPGLLFVFSPKLFYRYASLMPDRGDDVGSYVIGWTSGDGLREATQWLTAQGQDKQINVAFDENSGNPGDATAVLLKNKKEVKLITTQKTEPIYIIESGQGKDPRFTHYQKAAVFPRFESNPVVVYTVNWK